MKRVRTKSSDIAGNMEPPKKSKESPKYKRSPSPKDRNKENKENTSPKINGFNNEKHESAKFTLRIISHGRVNGPVDDPDENEEMLKFSVRDVANPPAKLRKTFTGLSPRLRKEIFSDKMARQKYDTIVIEMEKMMTSMEAAMNYDATHVDEVDEPTITTLIVSIQCEEGKHRSVSYAEELSQSTKRKDWEIQVEHRDLGAATVNGGDEESESDEPVSPTGGKPRESTRSKKKKDKFMKKVRNQRIQVEVVGSGAEDGFF